MVVLLIIGFMILRDGGKKQVCE